MQSILDGVETSVLPAFCTLPPSDFDLCVSHTHTLLPATLASVSFGFEFFRIQLQSRFEFEVETAIEFDVRWNLPRRAFIFLQNFEL